MTSLTQRLARKLGWTGKRDNDKQHTTVELALELPRQLRRGWLRQQEYESVQSGVELLDLMTTSLGLENLGNTSVLDMGCGCKFTQAILTHDIPIGKYTGLDVYAEMIDFLDANVSDPRFSFHRVDSHNEMYNPDGEPLTEHTKLPVGEEKFDLICLFSVFTHLAPHDYVAMLKVLRNYIKPDGKLFFSVFINERTAGGHGHVDVMGKGLETVDEATLAKHAHKFREAAREDGSVPDFIDADGQRPLWVALYSRKHALELVEGTGWKVESLNDPVKNIQHYMICTPD